MGWIRAVCAAVGVLSWLASCAGEDFESGGSGAASGTSGSAGSAGAGATCTSGDASTAPIGDCTDELFCKSCNQVTTGEPSCDECARTHCCAEALDCMSDLSCARLMACHFKRCKDRSATTCTTAECADCLQNYGEFALSLGPCIKNNCKAPVDLCPQLVW